MKRILRLMVIFSLVISLFPICVHAQTAPKLEAPVLNEEMEKQFSELYLAGGIDGLWEDLSPEQRKMLEKQGISGLNADTLLHLDFFSIFTDLWDTVKEQLTAPFSLLLFLTGILLITALMKSIGFRPNQTKVFLTVSTLCISGTVLTPLIGIIQHTSNAISSVSKFIMSFIPVYAGIITAMGKPMTAVAYNTFLFTSVQTVSVVSAQILVPLLGVYLAFCVVFTATDTIDISEIAASIKSIVTWSLGFLMTIFIGFLSLQGFVANAGDHVSIKVTKFALSSFVPVVGSALGDALSSVYGCVGLLHSTVGSFGIMAVIAGLLPPLLSLVGMMLTLQIAHIAAGLLGVGKESSILKTTNSVLGLLFGILLCFAALLIVSLTIMLATAR